MNRWFRLISAATVIHFASTSAFADGLSTFGERSFLCVKRVGKVADGGNNRGRDAYMNPAPCPRGYYTIDLSVFLKSSSVAGDKGDKGDTGAAGAKGDTGAQGAPGISGGSIIGRLVTCDCEDEQSEVVNPEEAIPGNPCELLVKSKRSKKNGGYEIYIEGESFAARPDASCVFRMSNVPAGIYDLGIDKQYIGGWIRGVGEVNVTEGTTTDLGDIPLCRDADRDGFDKRNDCNDWDPEINPDAVEACDGKDNNCDGNVDEGCAPPSEATPPS